MDRLDLVFSDLEGFAVSGFIGALVVLARAIGTRSGIDMKAVVSSSITAFTGVIVLAAYNTGVLLSFLPIISVLILVMLAASVESLDFAAARVFGWYSGSSVLTCAAAALVLNMFVGSIWLLRQWDDLIAAGNEGLALRTLFICVSMLLIVTALMVSTSRKLS